MSTNSEDDEDVESKEDEECTESNTGNDAEYEEYEEEEYDEEEEEEVDEDTDDEEEKEDGGELTKYKNSRDRETLMENNYKLERGQSKRNQHAAGFKDESSVLTPDAPNPIKKWIQLGNIKIANMIVKVNQEYGVEFMHTAIKQVSKKINDEETMTWTVATTVSNPMLQLETEYKLLLEGTKVEGNEQVAWVCNLITTSRRTDVFAKAIETKKKKFLEIADREERMQ